MCKVRAVPRGPQGCEQEHDDRRRIEHLVERAASSRRLDTRLVTATPVYFPDASASISRFASCRHLFNRW